MAALSLSSNLLANCYTIGPYVGIEANRAHLKLDLKDSSSLQAHKIKPYGYVGAYISPKLSIELGSNFKPHRIAGRVETQILPAINGRTVTLTHKIKPKTVRHVDLRLVAHLPLDDKIEALAGAGVSHVKLSGHHYGVAHKSQKLVPHLLLGLKAPLNEYASLRASVNYHHPLGLTAANTKLKSNVGLHAGLMLTF